MAEIKITIGGREFYVACHDGEEHSLQTAASLLDQEAGSLGVSFGRLPESQMLLMSGLMLGHKIATLNVQLRQATVAAQSVDNDVGERLRKSEEQVTIAQEAYAKVSAELAGLKSASEAIQTAVQDADEFRSAAIDTMEAMVKSVEDAAEKFKQQGGQNDKDD